MRLAPDGKSVTITLRIYQPLPDSQGRPLCDRAIAASWATNTSPSCRPGTKGAVFGPGSEARAEAPLDIQEVARTAAGLLVHIDSAATNINDALIDARRTIFSLRALTNLSATFDNFHAVSERSLAIVDNVDALVETNRAAVAVAVSNLLFFSEQLNQSASALRELVATNSPDIEAAVKNLESSSATLKNLLEGVQAGKGLAGKLLENEEIAANVSQIVSNLSITTSNLNRLGLWGILWQHKPPRTNAPAPPHEPLTPPKNPFE